MRVCSIKDCGKKHYGKEYCNIHWQRYKRHGDALITKYYYKPLELKLAKMKRCRSCKEIKPYSEFSKNKHNKDKCQDSCKKCRKVIRDIIKNKYNGLYRVWLGMKQRCSNSNSYGFKRYGGRGITVCNEWKNSFHAFYSWAKQKHKKGLTIDRRNNDGNYEPNNCRFVTNLVNIRNCPATKLNIVKVKWIKKLLEGKLSQAKIAKKFGVTITTIYLIKVKKTWKDV